MQLTQLRSREQQVDVLRAARPGHIKSLDSLPALSPEAVIKLKERSDKLNISKGWSDFLGRYEWHEFFHGTFRHPMHNPVRIVDMFEWWLKHRIFEHATSVGDAVKCTRPERDRNVGADERLLKRRGLKLPPRPECTWYKGKFVDRWDKHRGRPVWVMGIEPHKSGALHFHAIIHHRSYERKLRRDLGWLSWKYGFKASQEDWVKKKVKSSNGWGNNKLEKPDSQEAVRGYVSKYVCKNETMPGWYHDVVFSRTLDAKVRPSESPHG